jgi:hypothetical protein
MEGILLLATPPRKLNFREFLFHALL